MLCPSSRTATTAAATVKFVASRNNVVVRGTVRRAFVSQLPYLFRQYQLQQQQQHNGDTTSSSCGRCHYSTSAASKNWAAASNSGFGSGSNRQAAAAPSLRNQRRPIVNGEAVAFHVNDLKRMPEKIAPPISSSVNRNNNNKSSSSSLSLSATTTTTRRSYDSDLVVVLDMDECLIHSQFLSSPNAAQVYAHQLKQRRMNNTSAHGLVDSFRFSLPDGDLVHVNLRPGLRDFLKAVTDRFETHVFTAAVELYANPLLDRLDSDGSMFAGRWYREHCAWDSRQGAYVKDLSRLPPLQQQKKDDHSRVVLVDNNPLSFLANPENGILVSSFYNDPKDTTLPAVWELLQELDEHHKDDVRPVLEQRFGLKEALQDVNSQAATAQDL